jgi:type II secretory pathway pseudopilin PulG
MRNKTNENRKQGFSLLEVLVAIPLITVGLLVIVAVFAQGISTTAVVQEELLAKQMAREALESVFTARSTQNLTFDQINNASVGGIFQDGFQLLRDPGNDGLANTADDGAQVVITTPGPDGLLGTADDEVRPLNYFEREIQIRPYIRNGGVDPDLRQIDVIVRYRTSPNSTPRTYTLSSYISRFA